MKKAFTLAEILIVLVIIGVLTMILLPIAFQSSPDEEVMKFKKGNNTLSTVIRELVSSDKYYQDGDLGIKTNGNLIDGKHDDDITYFCETFADVISTKKVNCSEVKNGDNTTSNNVARVHILNNEEGDNLQEVQENLDEYCLEYTQAGEEIVSTDGIIYYQTTPYYTFGFEWDYWNPDEDENIQNPHHRLFGALDAEWTKNNNGFDPIYKPFCMDIDGINKGVEPFGYGIRADGKILLGKRALEWQEKEIQK